MQFLNSKYHAGFKLTPLSLLAPKTMAGDKVSCTYLKKQLFWHNGTWMLPEICRSWILNVNLGKLYYPPPTHTHTHTHTAILLGSRNTARDKISFTRLKKQKLWHNGTWILPKGAFIYDVRCFLVIFNLPTYPHQILYYISLFIKIRWSLTYLPTQKSDVIYECSLNDQYGLFKKSCVFILFYILGIHDLKKRKENSLCQ